MTSDIKTSEIQLRDEDQLSLDLIEAQYALKASRDGNCGKSVLILVNGVELAGKGEAVKQLREWMDPRYLGVKANTPNEPQYGQPFWQPYRSAIPAEGQIVILFGNWYGDALFHAVHEKQPDILAFAKLLEQIRLFEQYLQQNQVDVLRFWFDLDWEVLQKRLDDVPPSQKKWHRLHGLDWRNKQHYERLQSLSAMFKHECCVIDGADPECRDQHFAQKILQHLQDLPERCKAVKQTWLSQAILPELNEIPKQALKKSNYKKKLKKLSRKVADALRDTPKNVVIAFEGMDAAGKGGAIKRIVKHLDPREYTIHTIAAPEKYELRRPYLWRFWTKLPEHQGICIFDRTWYGRVLVERVEGFASETEWQRAFDEINQFEEQLIDSGVVVIKLWLAISLEEQAERFKAREDTPHKRFKITEEDWRNREKWDDYLVAASDMLHYTDTAQAPWYVIASDDKYQARIAVLEAILKQLKASAEH